MRTDITKTNLLLLQDKFDFIKTFHY